MRYILAIIMLFSLSSAYAQLRLVSNGTPSWSPVNDSTYTGTINFHSDLTGNSYLATNLTTDMRVFTSREQVYRIDSLWNQTFSGASMRIVEFGSTNGSPMGQVMAYDPDGRETVPAVPSGSTGSTAQMQGAVISWNAKQAASIGNPIDSTTTRNDSIFVHVGGAEYFSGMINQYIIDSLARPNAYFDVIATGQSNMVGRDLTVGAWTYNLDSMVLAWTNSSNNFTIADPGLNNISPDDANVTDSIRNNIAWAFAKEYRYHNPFDTVRFLVSAKGGEASTTWTPDPADLDHTGVATNFMLDSLLSKLSRTPENFDAEVVLWQQGETDDLDVYDIPMSDYINNLVEIYDTLANHSKVKDDFIMLTGYPAYTDDGRFDSLILSLDSLYFDLRDVGLRRIVPVKFVADNNPIERFDDSHFTNEMIDKIGKAYYQTLISFYLGNSYNEDLIKQLIKPSNLAQEGAAVGQVPAWDGSNYVPTTVSNYLDVSDTVTVCNIGCDYTTLNQALEYASSRTLNLYDSLGGNKVIIAARNNSDGSQTVLQDRVAIEGGNWSNITITSELNGDLDTIIWQSVERGGFDYFISMKTCVAPNIFDFYVDRQGNLGEREVGIYCFGVSNIEFQDITLKGFSEAYSFTNGCSGRLLRCKAINQDDAATPNGFLIGGSLLNLVDCRADSTLTGRGFYVQQGGVARMVRCTSTYHNASLGGLVVRGATIFITDGDFRRDGVNTASTDINFQSSFNLPSEINLRGTVQGGTVQPINVHTDLGVIRQGSKPYPFMEVATAQEPDASSGIRFYWNTDCNCLKVSPDNLNWITLGVLSALDQSSQSVDAEGNSLTISDAGSVNMSVDFNRAGHTAAGQLRLSNLSSVPTLLGNNIGELNESKVELQNGEIILTGNEGTIRDFEIINSSRKRFEPTITSTSTATFAQNTEYTIDATSSGGAITVTINVPAAIEVGHTVEIYVIGADVNTVTLDMDTGDGDIIYEGSQAATRDFTGAYHSLFARWDGTNLRIDER